MAGMTTDQQFEKTLSDLAFAHLQDAAPALVDYMLGFQVLDVNDDQTRGTGIFGCKVGKEMIYLPVFFLNGELKGSELMYLKNQDIFVPLQEAWVQYILNRKPHQLGEATDTTMKDLAGTGLDLFALGQSPQNYGKMASEAPKPAFYMIKKGNKLRSIRIPCWTRDQHPDYAEVGRALKTSANADHYKQAASRLDLCAFLSECKPLAVKSFINAMVKNAGFGKSVLNFYPIEKLTSIKPKLVKRAEATPQLPDVRIITYGERNSYDGLMLDDNDKSRLMNGEIVIKDHRKDTTNVYKLSTPLAIQPPNVTGVYELYTKFGDLIKCFIIVSPMEIRYNGGALCCKSYGRRAQKDPLQLEIINLDGQGKWSGPIDNVYARPIGDSLLTGSNGYKTATKEVSSISEGETYALVDGQGHGTQCFHVLRKSELPDGDIHLHVTTELDPSEYTLNNWNEGSEIVIVKGRTGAIKFVSDTIFAPADSVRAIKVDVKKVKRDENGNRLEWDNNYGMPKPGDPKLIERLVWGDSAVIPMKIYSTGTEYDITLGNVDGSTKAASMKSGMQALRHLVFDLGINGDVSLALLKKADVDSIHKKASKYLIKKSAYPMLGTGPTAPSEIPNATSMDPMLGVQSTQPQSSTQAIEGMQADPNDFNLYDPNPQLDKNIYQMVDEASQSGQKEVFDTAMIGGLISTADSDAMVDKYIGDLILGMDRVGRIYFLYLQKYDNFKERYGQEDLIELEDSLKNTFKSMGDLILFLKQKTAETGKAQDRTKVRFK